jgi:hypothetical protein
MSTHLKEPNDYPLARIFGGVWRACCLALIVWFIVPHLPFPWRSSSKGEVASTVEQKPPTAALGSPARVEAPKEQRKEAPKAEPEVSGVTVTNFSTRLKGSGALSILPWVLIRPLTCGDRTEQGDGRIHCVSIVHRDPEVTLVAESAKDTPEVAWLAITMPSPSTSADVATLAYALFNGLLATFSPQLDAKKREATIKRLAEGFGRQENNVRIGRFVYSLAPVLPMDNGPVIFSVATFERDWEMQREWQATRRR